MPCGVTVYFNNNPFKTNIIMDEQIRQIAERLRGLRDVLELTADDIARDCDISAEEYRLAETGEFDISVSMLQKIARHYGISLDALMFGQEPKMSSYFDTCRKRNQYRTYQGI